MGSVQDVAVEIVTRGGGTVAILFGVARIITAVGGTLPGVAGVISAVRAPTSQPKVNGTSSGTSPKVRGKSIRPRIGRRSPSE